MRCRAPCARSPASSCWPASTRCASATAKSYLLITVLACFLGGVNPFGGFGRVVSVFLALVILQVLSSGLNLLGANQHLATAIWGILLIAVMILRWAARHVGHYLKK